MNLKNRGTRKELAQLLCAVMSHPAATPALKDGINDILSEVHAQVDPYGSPAGIELYLDAHAEYESNRQALIRGS